VDDRSGIVARILGLLDVLAVPVHETSFSIEVYNQFFPRGTITTPVGEVKLGKNQFQKLEEKDSGKRRPLIEAMYQTLSDPIIIIAEHEDDRFANVFIKSFKKEGERDFDTIMSVVVTIGEEKIAISTYKRKKREVLNKIKKADGIIYIKDDSGSQTNGTNARH
jgi:tRNA(Ile)-lysidine synthase TilS/MesJ